MPELEFYVVVLNEGMSTFLNMRRVRLLALKNSERESAMMWQGSTFSKALMTAW